MSMEHGAKSIGYKVQSIESLRDIEQCNLKHY